MGKLDSKDEEDVMGSPESFAAEEQAAIVAVIDCIYRHPRHRELYYKALEHCLEERELEEAEVYLESQVEYRGALQTSTTLIDVLIECGGLAYAEYDAEGSLLTEQTLAEKRAALEAEGELDPESIDDVLYDLVARRTLKSTPAGAAAAELLQPEKRIAGYAASVPERRRIYLQVLEFCREPRSLEDINALLEGDPLLEPTARTSGQKLQASYFIDRLDEAGGLAWDGAWSTTPAGIRFLASLEA